MSTKVTTAVVLFKKRQKKNGTYPAKLRLTCDRRQMYYTIDTKNRVYEFTEDDFNKITGPKPRGEFKEIQLEFSLIEEKAQKIIKSMSEFSFDQFKAHFGIAGGNMRNVFHYLDLKVAAYKKNGYGEKNAGAVKAALQQFFKRTTTLEFREVTVPKLREFEVYMRNKGIRPTTYNHYIECLKSTFFMAQRENMIPVSLNPFGRDKYFSPRVITVKRALKLEEIEKIYNYEPIPNSGEEEAKDLWMFTYLCNGINMTDICSLRYRDVGENFITFIRKKTEHSASTRKPITIAITDDIRKIIERRGNPDRNPDNFVFPYLSDDLTYKQNKRKVEWRVQKTNKHMKEIGKKLKIEKHITTYTARHSFATILKRSGVSIEFISESLGHRDVGITETYLDSFEDDHKLEVAKHLTAFRK